LLQYESRAAIAGSPAFSQMRVTSIFLDGVSATSVNH
jgi:hypothetical protein